MGDPWGPPKRKVTPISEWFSSWPAIAGQYINAEWIDGKPVYTQENFQVILQAMDSAGSLHHLVDTSGRVTEASGVTIADNLALMRLRDYNSDFHTWDAAGVPIETSASRVGVYDLPVVVTADGAGNIGAAADLIGATASRYIDAEWCMIANTTGSYTTRFCQDPTGTPAATTPDWHTAAPALYLVAGYPTPWFRVKCTADNVAFGYDAGVNGNWPNGAIVDFVLRHRRL